MILHYYCSHFIFKNHKESYLYDLTLQEVDCAQ